MSSDPIQLLLWFVPLLLLAGAFAGVLAGMLGVGGGAIIVPALFLIFGYLGVDPSVKMHLAVGTSLATIIPTSIRSMRAHQVRGSFDAQLYWSWLPALAVGVLVGSWLASMANTFMLTVMFGVVVLIVALQMVFARIDLRIADKPPEPPAKWALAGTIGTISAMMGIGAGSLSIPTMSMYGVPMHRAVGTSAGFGLVIGIAGTVGFIWNGWQVSQLPPYSLGYVNWLGLLVIAPATVIFVPLGASFAHSLSQVNLRRVFAAFLVIVAVRMLGDASGVF